MLVSLFRYLLGYLRIRVTGYSPERFLNLCKNKKIDVWGLEARQNAYDMYMLVSGFRKLKPILKKTNTKVTILERFGIPFFFHKYRKRRLFFTGVVAAVVLIYFMTFFVWDIQIEGNQRITNETLLEYLKEQDISHGMSKHKIKCEEIVKNIRKDFDDIIWVSVSTEGTRLHIHVKENTDTFEMQMEETIPSDILADKAGIVKSIVTRNGVPQVKVGDEVTEGMVLVSGTIDVLNDAKEVVSHRYVESDADIVMETAIHYKEVLSKKYDVKEYTKKKRNLFIFEVGNLDLELGWKKNKFQHYEVHTHKKQLRLGENFYLPLILGGKTLQEYKLVKKEYSKKEMEAILNQNFAYFCKQQEENGATILEKNLHITYNNKEAIAETTIMLLESVGIRRKIVDFQ